MSLSSAFFFIFFFQAEDGIRDKLVTGVQTCALPILDTSSRRLPSLAHNVDPGPVCGNRIPHGVAEEVSSVVLEDGPLGRSEERRVGKECRSRWSRYL